MLDLQNLLTGKNTLEVARAITDEFVRRYGTNWGTLAELMSHLVPRGKAPAWSGLDRYINLFCKQFYKTWEHDEDKINFLDEVRFCLADLPMKRDYKLPEHKEELTHPERVAELFETCSLCWRSVPRKPLEKKTPLCQLHDLPSSHPTYRKLARSKKQMEILTFELIKSQPPLSHLKNDLGAELNEYTKGLCLNENGALPHLARYLYSLDMPLSTGQEIMKALEYPVYLKKVSVIVRQAWEFYLDDRGKYFKLNYLKLLTAEAWLRTEAERKHGGKRR